MAPAVEARSLATLTALAANPPASCLRRADRAHDTLVLYIVRVPGSRGERRTKKSYSETVTLTDRLDVFLSTMKPREKVVTAQDVESSLYYFHVDVEEDEDVRNALQSATQAQQSQVKEGRHIPDINGDRLQRKSLPSSCAPAPQARHEPPFKVYPRFEPPAPGLGVSIQIARKPIGSNHRLINTLQTPAEQLSVRKPYGPRPQHPRIQSVDSALLEAPKGKENISPRRWSQQPPPLPARPQSDLPHATYGMDRPITDRSSHSVPLDYFQQFEHNPSSPRADGDSYGSATGSTCTRGSSITLIRRDPGSGGQWNIGRLGINMPGTEGDVWLEITNPGYLKFIRRNESEPDYTERLSISQGTIQDDLSWSTTDNLPGFQRKIFLGGYRARSHPVTPTQRESHFDPQTSHSTSPRLLVNNRLPISPGPQSPSQPNAYTFRSPWDGTCEFSTGLSGRSLKCKHRLPSPALSPGRSPGHSELVSELRFNLPGGKSFGRPTSKRPISETITSSKHSSSALSSQQSHHRSSIDGGLSAWKAERVEDDSDDDVNEKMDLSLGRERAGGGSGGKRAKLGKLIVTDEGLQMLDLIVAANMGIWWSVYEKG